MSTALAPLLADEPIATAVQQARDAIDELLWRRDIRADAVEVVARSVQRGARDSAAIDGADQVAVDDSPMGRVRSAAIAVTVEAATQDEVWDSAPLQVFAHLHAIAAAGFAELDERGRPRSGDDVDDPLRIGALPPASVIGPRISQLVDVVIDGKLPGVLEAALVHGEVMALRPFRWGSGLVGRAVVRTIFSARGVDPSMFSTPELGMFEAGRPAYVTAIRDFQSGTIEGMRRYVQWFSAAIQAGTRVG
jgi:hypothetical protein